ncbi:hypothetical protein [Celerinatantimonas sp. YJH-8]|uniref:hypothetical protein n=1 Tax=Celerinatantimonas sp. YJH-8 TaxID=3228714 RepID=UPI0038C6CD2B
MQPIKFSLGITLLWLLLAPVAHAHLLKVFAWRDGQAIVGNAYFSGGVPAQGANIRLQNKAGVDIATGHPNTKGDFRLEIPTGKIAVTVVADTHDGHIAHWDLSAADSDTTTEAPSTTRHNTPKATSASPAALDPTQLKNLISQAVAEQIGPLRMELSKDAGAFRFSDILGGIGYIFGLAGICFWLKSRKQAKT